MTRLIRTEGIVLKKRSLLNKDSIITVLTDKQGKIGIFAKGIKKITSRRLPHIQTGNLINIIINEKDNRYYLQETTLISGFTKIKNNEIKQQMLYIMLFVLERILPENQSEEQVYILTKHFLIELSENPLFSMKQLSGYLNTAMRYLGFLHKDKPIQELYMVIEDIIHEKIPRFDI